MSRSRYVRFDDFWLYYLREHRHPLTRASHYSGTLIGLFCLGYAIFSGQWAWLAGLPLAGYGCAWLSHAVIERNKPATFIYPLWSLAADYRMLWLFLTGRLAPWLRASEAPEASDINPA
jgi:hypothetical protein